MRMKTHLISRGKPLGIKTLNKGLNQDYLFDR